VIAWLVVAAELDGVSKLWLSETGGRLPVIIGVGLWETVPLLAEGPQPER